MDTQYKRDTETAAKVLMVARIMGVTKRFVRMVINDERKNEQVLKCYMEIQEAAQALEVKMMRRAFKQPLNQNPRR